MPDTPDFDAARRSLGDVPAPDLWPEAERRAAAAGVVPLDPDSGRTRRPTRWLAAAAVAVLAVGTIAVLADGDDGRVDTAHTADGSAPPCAISGLVFAAGPSPELTALPDPEARVTVHALAGPEQVPFEVSAPAVAELTTAGKVEAVDLDRGPAVLFLASDLTQVQYDPDGDEPCTSFSVTVAGANQKNMAIGIANQVVLTARRSEPAVIGADGCGFAFSEDPTALFSAGSSEPPLFDPSGQPEGQTIVHATLGADQVAEIHVPGLLVIDLVGERVEDVELRRGTAQLWFGPDFVQVGWFTGGQEPCESFTVTVAGGTEDGNRFAAVDLADRIMLPSELDEPVLQNTEWLLERSTFDGEATDGDGSLFSFTDTEASWSDGCNHFSGPYSLDDDILRIGGATDVTQTDVSCDPGEASGAVNAVMVEGGIAAIVDGDRLTLRTLDGELNLRRAGRTVYVGSAAYGIWPMTAPESTLGYQPEFIGSAEDTALEFARRVLGWADAVACCSQPTHDAWGVGELLISSPEREAEVSVRVAAADPAGNGHVVYAVSPTGAVGAAGVRVADGVGRVDLETPPPGTVRTELAFIFGEYVVEGAVNEDVEVDTSPGGSDTPIGGAALVLFRDGEGEVISAWGYAVPGVPVEGE